MEKRKYDLVVIGGGLAGTCCAIAAARGRLKTALVHDHVYLGGNASPEIGVAPEGAMAMGANRFADETGLCGEIRTDWDSTRTRDLGMLAQILWEKVSKEPNLALFINTRAVTPRTRSAKRITSVIVQNLGGGEKIELLADYFADCSGDGDIAFKAGAKFSIGRESRRKYGESLAPAHADKGIMGATLMSRFSKHHSPMKFIPPKKSVSFRKDDDLPYRTHDNLKGSPWWLEYSGDLKILKNEEKIRDRLYDLLFGLFDHLKNRGKHGCENSFISWISPYLAKRESRRFIGDHVLTQNDIEGRVLFHDAVSYGGWPIDIHPPSGILSKEPPATQCFVEPYNIPLRCLYSRNIENLFFAGRNISVSHAALGSTRVEWTCAAIGEAAGTAASLCKKFRCSPRTLSGKHSQVLQQQLLKQDCYIIGVRNKDRKDIARNSRVAASSSRPLIVRNPSRREKLKSHVSQTIPVTTQKIKRISLFLESARKRDITLKLSLYRCEQNNTFSKKFLVGKSKAVIAAHHKGWIDFVLEVVTRPGNVYWFALEKNPGIFLHVSDEEVMGVQRGWFDDKESLWRKNTGLHHDVQALWKTGIGTYCFHSDPLQFPFGPENIVNGVSRPELWPNIWMSDPEKKKPGEVVIHLKKKSKFNKIFLTFNNSLNRTWPVDMNLTDCIKSYEVLARISGKWRLLVKETDNFHRHRTHCFEPVASGKIKVRIKETRGSFSSQIFEVRIYFDKEEQPIYT